jgi:hypothetical protein
MKKITLLLFLLISCFSVSYGQVEAYSFSQSNATYNPITGGTVLGIAANDDTSFNALPIGFTFNFNGTAFTQFSVNSNGFLALGATVSLSYNAISAGVTNNVIAALNGDLQGNETTGELSYLTAGTAPNRVLTVQWKSYRHYFATGDENNFQIKLYETINVIDVVFGAFTQNATPRLREVGIRGGSNAAFKNRATTTDWTSTTEGTVNTASCTLSTSVRPASGLTFTWSPPPTCAGIPTSNPALSSAAVVCSITNFTLNLQNAITEAGYSYQWQSSADNVTFANISGANSALFTTTQTTNTYYRCVVTCTASAVSTAGSSVLVSMDTPLNCSYCVPTYTTGKTDGDLIANISISGTTLANNSGAAPVNPAYTFFSGQPNFTATLQAGSSYTVSVTVGTFGGQNAAVWIDYNDNGIFENSERVGFTAASIAANGTATFNITLSCNPPLGTHRMRVRDVWNTLGINIDPCINYGWGETEDYNITVAAAVACPQPSALAANSITTESAILSWTLGCVETAWDLHLTTAGGGAPTGVPNNTGVTSPFLADNLTPATSYEFYVRANCAGVGTSLWTGPFTFTTAALPPLNDDCSGAVGLTVGTNFASNASIVSTEAATASQIANPSIPAPGCSLYSGGDVWYSVVVPASGNVSIETNPNIGSTITDTGLVVYSGSCGALTLVECDDDDSLSGNFSLVNLTGRTPGEVLYIRVFEYGNDTVGTFQVAAFDCPSATPAPSGNATQVFCQSGTVAGLAATGTNIQWYNAATAGTLLTPATALVSGTSYFASQTLNCESFNRLEVFVTLESLVTPTFNSIEALCTTDAAPALPTISTNGVLGTWSPSIIDNSTAGTFTYTFTPNAGQCAALTTIDIVVTTCTPASCLTSQNGQWPGSAFTPNTTNCDGVTIQTITACGYANEFSVVNVVLGQTYTFGSSFSTDVITISTDAGATAVASGTGAVVWVSTITGPVRFYTHLTGCLEEEEDLCRIKTVICGVVSTDQPDYVNLQWPPAITITQGGSGIVYGQVYEGGLTDVAPNIQGQAPGIEAWVGISPIGSNTNPNTWTLWIPATWNSGNVSNNDEFEATIGANLLPGTYYYATRFRLNFGPFVYGGIDSSNNGNFWNGTSHNSGVLTVTAPPAPANDDCANAVVLTPGGVFVANQVEGLNVSATNSNPPAPDCAFFQGGDVWYSVTVPASGNITLETNPDSTSSITDTGLAVYSGTCSGLTLVECDDDDSATGNFSLISLTGRTPGEVLYVNVWEYGNDAFGTFLISAYDASLSNGTFDASKFTFYPNPVKNILNLSYDKSITKVVVINLLGQEVSSLSVNANQAQVDMGNLPSGTYLVKITSDTLVKTIKVIKQ